MLVTLCPPIERIRQRISYDADSGKLYWLHKPELTPHDRQWNARYAGAEALSTPTSRGYLQGKLDGEKLLAHRVCWALHHGVWPSAQIDHINHCKTDNRITNLRDVSPSENMLNRRLSTAKRFEQSGNWKSIGELAKRLAEKQAGGK